MKRLITIISAFAMATSPMANLKTKQNLIFPATGNLPQGIFPKISRVEPFSIENREPEIKEEEPKEEVKIAEQPGPAPIPAEENVGVEVFTPETANYATVWNGSVLTPSAGVNQGPSGTERYYNLDMSGVVSIAKNSGIEGDYWVREDGVKMYGGYIICACGFSVRPRGTVVQTSLGPGICLDTGGFAANDPYMIDIAVTW